MPDPEPAEAAGPAEPDRDDETLPAAPRTKDPPKTHPDLYDPATIPEFELELDAPAMAVLTSADPAQKKTWVHGRFKFGSITFADVGVRRKGSATYRILPSKSSLKVKFNKWVKGQKVYGLEEITLNNTVYDPTFLAERLTYHLFRTMGLAAPKANTAHLTINGEDYGIFANIETPDENFLSRVFGAKANTLYEAASRGATWLPDAADGFKADVPFPGAPEGAMPDADLLFQAVARAKDATLLADLDGHLYTKDWLRFAATEALTSQSDGYAYGTIGYSHNYFLAGDTSGKFSLVPWSADLTLNDREVMNVAIPPNQTVFARCRLGETCWDAYKTEVRSVLATYETTDIVNIAKKWHDQIDPLVRSDPKREVTLSRYEREIETLYAWLAGRANVVRAQLGL